MLEQNLVLLYYIFLTVARMINYMCMMDDDYGKLWHYIDFPCCVPSFSHQLCFSVSGEHKPSLRSTKHRVHQCSSDSSDPEERQKNQLLSWPQSTRSHRQHFSSLCAQLIVIAVSCFVSRLCLTIGSLGPTRMNEGHPTQKTDHCMLFSKGLPAVDQNPSKNSNPFLSEIHFDLPVALSLGCSVSRKTPWLKHIQCLPDMWDQLCAANHANLAIQCHPLILGSIFAIHLAREEMTPWTAARAELKTVRSGHLKTWLSMKKQWHPVTSGFPKHLKTIQ